MRRVVVTMDAVSLEDAPRPVPAPNEVLVRMTVTGICGTDTHAAHGRHPFVPLPYFPGHEVVGVVEDTGPDMDSVTTGQRVTVEPPLTCGECKMCNTGRSNLCERLTFFGCGYDQGGMADYFTVPASRLHVVPEQFTDLQAALIEPLATPVHAVRISGGVQDKTVVIIGAGTIGLLTLATVRFAGARRVVMTDVLASKRERALRLGADAVFDAARDDVVEAIRADLGESADVVFDCVSVQATMDQSVALASKGGTIVVVGVAAAPVTVPLPQIQDHQMRIQGSATYLAEDYRQAMDIISSGEVQAGELVTSQYSLEEAADAFADSSGGEEVKVVLLAR